MDIQNGPAGPAGTKGLRDVLSRRADMLCLLFVILLPGIWSILTFDKTAMVSEGWYVVYSKMILAGKTPYVDFELAFPPVYAYFSSFVVLVFGESLIAFRVIGIFVTAGIAVLSYYIFRQVFPPWVAAFAAIIVIFTIQSENSNIAYDYIRFYDLFNYLAFYLLLRSVVRSHRKEPVNLNRDMFIAGISCAVALLLRQTSGMIVSVYFAVFLILILLVIKSVGFRRKNVCSFLIGLSVPIVITFAWLAAMGALTPFLEMTILSGSKGGLSNMLFAWIPKMFSYNAVLSVIIIFVAVCFAAVMAKRGFAPHPAGDRYDHLFYCILILSVAVLILTLFFLPDLSALMMPYWYSMLTPMFVISTALGAALLFRIIKMIRRGEQVSLTEIAYVFFCGFIFAVGFGSGTSSSLSHGQSALSYGFIVAVILGEISRIPVTKLRLSLKTPAAALIVLFLVAVPVSIKVITPYAWWELTAEGYSNMNCETDISYFSGIKMTADDKFVYEDFTAQAKLYLGDGDEIYCYSQIGIFYVLADRVPTVKAPIPWFDVAREETVLEDLNYLQNNNPKMIVFADHGEYVISMHEELFNNGNELGHRAMYNWLQDCRDPSGNYTELASYSVQDYTIYLLLRK